MAIKAMQRFPRRATVTRINPVVLSRYCPGCKSTTAQEKLAELTVDCLCPRCGKHSTAEFLPIVSTKGRRHR